MNKKQQKAEDLADNYIKEDKLAHQISGDLSICNRQRTKNVLVNQQRIEEIGREAFEAGAWWASKEESQQFGGLFSEEISRNTFDKAYNDWRKNGT
jgi:hypothetical protein